jgi:hypothetical protein
MHGQLVISSPVRKGGTTDRDLGPDHLEWLVQQVILQPKDDAA